MKYLKIINKKIAKISYFKGWRGLRDDFRTLDWVEVIEGLEIKKLEQLIT